MHVVRLAHGLRIEFNELDRLRGKTILDVACGQTGNIDPNFHPWFARIATHLGCIVTGVDFKRAEDPEMHEAWTYVDLDLRSREALFHFPDDSFDVTHSTYFIGNQHPKQDNDPQFVADFQEDMGAYIQAQKTIFWHMNRIVKPSGVVIINDSAKPKR
jgi:ubiquinone/menaquinone biosynthesis C-methylase UbiE